MEMEYFILELHHVDGLTLSGVRQLLKAKKDCAEDFITLTGCSGRIWGVAMRSTDGCLKPIFISIGDRISLDTAIKIVKMTCKYRVPESIRQVKTENTLEVFGFYCFYIHNGDISVIQWTY